MHFRTLVLLGCLALTAPLVAGAEPVTWGSLVSATTASGGGIRKAPGGSWYGAAAGTTALSGDGRLEFRVTHTGISPYVNATTVCLDSGSSNPVDRATLDHCILVGAGVAAVYERGRWTQETPVAVSDTLTIAVQGGVVRYERNGTVFHTSGLRATFPTRPVWMAAYDGYGVSSASITASGTTTPPTPPPPSPSPGTSAAVGWTGLVSATAPGDGTVRKVAGTSWYAAARSTQTLSGDGRFEFSVSHTGVNPVTTAMRFCLNAGSYDIGTPASLEHCLVVGAGYASVYVAGRWSSDVATSTSDRLAVGVEGGVVRYYRNGTAFYTAGGSPAFPLNAVWTTNFDGYGLTHAQFVGSSSSTPPPAPPPPTTGSATLSWTPPTTRTDGSTLSNLAGYRIYYGTSAGALSRTVIVSNPSLSRYVVEGLSPATWYFAMTAVDTNGAESARTSTASKVIQ